jgi:putative two-component system response regulator
MAEEIARSHHESWDGKGYPAGLANTEIPMSGRLVAVADVFDALTHARPYKTAWTIDAAVAEITRCAGTRFDPEVVAAFLSLTHAYLLAPVRRTLSVADAYEFIARHAG